MTNNSTKPKILIIDDSLYDRFMYKSILGESDYKFIEFSSGSEFLEVSNLLQDIELVILDGILPDKKCNEIIEVIIREKIVSINKVLLCTGLNNFSETIKGLPENIAFLNKTDLLVEFKNKVDYLLKN